MLIVPHEYADFCFCGLIDEYFKIVCYIDLILAIITMFLPSSEVRESTEIFFADFSIFSNFQEFYYEIHQKISPIYCCLPLFGRIVLKIAFHYGTFKSKM